MRQTNILLNNLLSNNNSQNYYTDSKHDNSKENSESKLMNSINHYGLISPQSSTKSDVIFFFL